VINQPHERSEVKLKGVSLVALTTMTLSGVLPAGSIGISEHAARSEASFGITQIAAGGAHTCALLANGSAECWGDNNFGQLGDGSTTGSTTPAEVAGLQNIVQIAAGTSHTCASLASGSMDCWGYNSSGQLGNGSTTNSSTPLPVSGGGISAVTQITTGSSDTCSLFAQNFVNCWGANTYGEIGINDLGVNFPQPLTVAGVPGALEVEAGLYHTCAIVAAGSVDCWGHNLEGQLGRGSETETSYSTPAPVTGLTAVTQVSVGYNDTCALLAGRTVDCWGANNDGELGNGTTTDFSLPQAVNGLTGVTQIQTQGEHTCALLAGGTVVCWGLNSAGQLGNGTTTNSSAPEAVEGLTGVTQIAAGSDFTCALLAGGTVDCWGLNSAGQLGNGTTTNSTTPIPVQFPMTPSSTTIPTTTTVATKLVPPALSIGFAARSYKLSANAKNSLVRLSKKLIEQATVTCTGYAKGNVTLAKNRAKAVAAFLLRKVKIHVNWKTVTKVDANKVTVVTTEN
jgi:alpha-tubulin suppressor-like RCC1 family protein